MVGKRDTRFLVVRYGNVVCSRGSVIPCFRQLMVSGATELPITHKEMTRFMITLQQGVNFVLKNFKRMQGGGIFIPKIPSMYITDLATAIAPHLPQKIVGIRPGKKLHEIMCPADDSHLTFEFKDHYVISPTIQFTHQCDFSKNNIGEKGVPFEEGFEYNSGSNKEWLSQKELLSMAKDIQP